ncbi:MAG: hypothetical protein ACLTE2_12395 [Eubacteriales bacterium]
MEIPLPSSATLKLKPVKGDNNNYIIIQGKKFEVTDGKICSAKGYIPVGNHQFVRLEKTYLMGIIIAGSCGIAACGVIVGLAIALPLQNSGAGNYIFPSHGKWQ